MTACAIIVTYHTGPALARCLAALSGADAVDEIIIVDNGNAPAETELLDGFAKANHRVRLLRGRGNVGFAAACNLGASNARSDVLVFVNPDVVLASGAIEDLVGAVLERPSSVLIGGDLRDHDGRPERGARRDRLTMWSALVTFSGMSRLEGMFPALRDYNRHRDPLPHAATPVGAVSGALMAMRRSDFEAIGGFDEGYFLHVEDMGAPMSILELGKRLVSASERDIDIVFTGLRPGEKLSEQLVDDYETTAPTSLPGVFRITPRSADAYLTSADVAHLETIARTMGNAAVRQRVFAQLDQRLQREILATG